MIAVVQRVGRAQVRVGGEAVATIPRGLVALVAVLRGDGEADVGVMADKLLNLRVFEDQGGLMNRSLVEVGGGLLVVPQFTLAADTRRGRRPSFARAAPPEEARRLYDALVARLRQGPVPVQTGAFGARMELELVNDGPVTVIVDTWQSRRGDTRRPAEARSARRGEATAGEGTRGPGRARG